MISEQLVSPFHYINIHTHRYCDEQDTFSIVNKRTLELQGFVPRVNNFYSIGFHPWYINDNPKGIQQVIEYAKHGSFIAIGETGIDKNTTDSIDRQTEIFLKQVKIAETYHKPVIVHCVRAYSEMMAFLKKYRPAVPIIFHGFNENADIAGGLLRFNVFFSFGVQLFNRQTKAPSAFPFIPPEKIFLETDDSDISLKEIYALAAELRSISVNDLKSQVFHNFRDCFNFK